MDDMVEGGNNTAIGANALGGALDATADASTHNVFVGKDAGSGAWVTAVSEKNVGIGNETLMGAMNGVTGAVAVGHAALAALTTGAGNTAVGYKAMQHADTAENCIAIGYRAMADQNVGGSGHAADSDNNIAIGSNSMYGAWADAKSEQNIAIGSSCMSGALNTATDNTCIGYASATAITSSSNNTIVGSYAGTITTTGSSNTLIGYNAEANANSGTNQTCIGYDCQGIGDNYAVIGDGNTTRLYAADDVGATLYAGSATVETSDERIKEDIKDSSLGLDFINQLRAIEYKKRQPIDYDESLKKEMNWYKNDRKPRVLDELDKNKSRTGFIAQEVGEALKNIGFDDNNDIVEIDESNTQQMIAYSKLVPPLVKAVQELTAKVEALENA